MFVWAPIPEKFKPLGSLEFSKVLLKEANISVAPGMDLENMVRTLLGLVSLKMSIELGRQQET